MSFFIVEGYNPSNKSYAYISYIYIYIYIMHIHIYIIYFYVYYILKLVMQHFNTQEYISIYFHIKN